MFKMVDEGFAKFLFGLRAQFALLLMRLLYEERHEKYLVLLAQGFREGVHSIMRTKCHRTISGCEAHLAKHEERCGIHGF